MRGGQVVLYRMDLRTVRYRDGWKFNPRGRSAWLQRLLFRALRRLGAIDESFDERVDVIRLPLSAARIFERIYEAYSGLFSVHCKPTEVLIGPDTLSELISCPEVQGYNSPFTIDATAGFNRKIYGLPIRVVPQMEGVVVLDDRSRK